MVDFAGGSLFRPVQFDFTKGVEFIQRRDQLNLQAAQTAIQAKQQQFDQRSRDASSALRTQELMLRKSQLTENQRQFDARFALNARQAAADQAAANALAGIEAHDVEQGPASTYQSFQNIAGVRLPGTSASTFGKYQDQVAGIIAENLDSTDPNRRQEAISVVLQDQNKFFSPEQIRRAGAHVRSDYNGAVDEVRGASSPMDLIRSDYQAGKSPTSSLMEERARLQAMQGELEANPFITNPAIIPRSDQRQGMEAVQSRLDTVTSTLESYERGVRQYQSGAGAETAMDRQALDMVWSSQFEQSFASGDPAASGQMLRQFAERTGYIPDSAAQTFSGWLDSPDNPQALMAASETWRQLEAIGGGVAPFELEPAQASMLAATRSVRRTMAREEQAARGSEDPAAMEAFGVLMADKVQSYIDGKKNSDQSLASADMQRYMIGNEHGKALGLTKFRAPKERGSGTEERFSIPPDLQNDFETNFFIGMDETNDPEAASEYAFSRVKQNWSASPFQGEPMAFAPSILSELPEEEANKRVKFELQADVQEELGFVVEHDNMKLQPRINNDGRVVYGVSFRDGEGSEFRTMLNKAGDGPLIYSPEFESVEASKTRMVVNGRKAEEVDAPLEIEEFGGASEVQRAMKALPGPSLGGNNLKTKLTSLGAGLTRSKVTNSKLVRSRKNLTEALKTGGQKGDSYSKDLFGYFDLSTQANLETLSRMDPRAESLVDRNMLRVAESIRTIRNTIGENGRLPPELRMYEKISRGEMSASEAVDFLKKNKTRREVADGN